MVMTDHNVDEVDQDVMVVRVVTDEENRVVRRRVVLPVLSSLNSVVDSDVVVVLPLHLK